VYKNREECVLILIKANYKNAICFPFHKNKTSGHHMFFYFYFSTCFGHPFIYHQVEDTSTRGKSVLNKKPPLHSQPDKIH